MSEVAPDYQSDGGVACDAQKTFGARLRAAIGRARARCASASIRMPQLLAAWGLPDDPTGLATFCQIVVEALADRVAVFKPQSAFFERFGSRRSPDP